MQHKLIVAAFGLAIATCTRNTTGHAQQGGVERRPPNDAGQTPVFRGQTRAPGREAIVAFDVVTVARGLQNPCGLAFLPSGTMLVAERLGRLRVVEAWKGSLFIGGLASTNLVRLTLEDEKVVGEERLLTDLQPARERIRDVRQGADGALHLLTDNAAGRILKLMPKK